MSKNPDNSLHKNGVCYWDVKVSDDWGDDCLVGEEYARMYLTRGAIEKDARSYGGLCAI